MDTLDPSWVKTQLSSYPFVIVEGVSNIRTLGNYPSTTHPGFVTKPNFIFRSGEISRINETGKQQLEELGQSILHAVRSSYTKKQGIKKVFDLRSDVELEKFGAPVPELAASVNLYRVPVFKLEDYSPEMIARRYKLYATGKTEVFHIFTSRRLDCRSTLVFHGTLFPNPRTWDCFLWNDIQAYS